MGEKVKDAVLWQPIEGSKSVSCNLCNFHCRIKEDKAGICQVRKNIDGKLYSLNYHAICAIELFNKLDLISSIHDNNIRSPSK